MLINDNKYMCTLCEQNSILGGERYYYISHFISETNNNVTASIVINKYRFEIYVSCANDKVKSFAELFASFSVNLNINMLNINDIYHPKNVQFNTYIYYKNTLIATMFYDFVNEIDFKKLEHVIFINEGV
jgi:hypothetical protein